MAADAITIVDPHLHLFDLRLGNYHWLQPANPPYWPDKHKIARDFEESDLHLPENWQLQGFVHIEAGFDNQAPWREIDWLEANCQLPFKSVACADLCSADFALQIAQLQKRRSVVGIRHILDEDALAVLSHPLCQPHFALLAQLGWSFDAQLALSDTPSVQALLGISRQFPDLAIIINHAGWPPPASDTQQRECWSQNMQALSKQANVAIKMSGWEMSDRQWLPETMLHTLSCCLSLFGDDRVMLASNFPLCTLSHSYATLWQSYHATLLNDSTNWARVWPQISNRNAARWYHLA